MTASELVAFAEELLRIAASGGGPKALAGHLARRTGVRVLVEDAQWRHLTAAGGSGIPSSVRPLLPRDGAAPSYSALRNGYAGRTLPMGSSQLHLGQLTIFGEGDLDALEHAVRLTAAAIGVELSRERGTDAGRRGAFWKRLSAGAYLDTAAARDDAASRSIAVATHYVAVALESEAVDAGASIDRSPLRTIAMEAFKVSDADVGFVERAETLLFFIPAAREIDAANARTAALLLGRNVVKKHSNLRLTGGVGTRVPLMMLPASVNQAAAALTISRRLYGNGHIGVYGDLGAYPLLLAGADPEALRAFARHTLAPLRTYDEKHQTELERTLRLYFAMGENVKTAAVELSVHRHTVFYRLRQINEICGRNLDDPHDQLTLRMAMAIDALTP